ncbi:hypothetical protein CFE70_007626 [Pyrenophora teres f. teres 0-1]|uniref:Hydrophobin n=2 Tax=Pyrenophora teres f. teres TaxID=97479 RepID=E3RW35_PYRTT|nr:hypothetical protein PTT_13432 [Pyrenophora teres f. teres 0-1]KAE8825393.1 hypothetical protein HRS9139_08503 [Pyrenophora teres f. teres]KAE8834490.1 hypothetical protein PTNB85_05823 [Pyrenophora teres f. teres]KAE8844029.1 hypothetical protein HRS9122_05132 [Pyrenophora teres f. teres]KAE8858914.1 hypothetical protein PTNB73_08394 [Pyrenophora teres f. teres]
MHFVDFVVVLTAVVSVTPNTRSVSSRAITVGQAADACGNNLELNCCNKEIEYTVGRGDVLEGLSLFDQCTMFSYAALIRTQDLETYCQGQPKLRVVFLHMLLYGPILDMVETIEPKIDKDFLSSCDVGEERVAENRHRWREIVARLVKEHELPTWLLFGFSLQRENMLLASRIRRVIWVMISKHTEDNAEFSQMFSKKLDQTDVLGVANVSE